MSVATPSTHLSSASTDLEPPGWMRGFLPSRIITFQDCSFRSFPELCWAWSNIRQLVPTVNVWREVGPALRAAAP